MPTLRQLKALDHIAQTRSFTRAAERLFITQSAMSGLIKDLEEEVGVELIKRGRQVRLTEAGELLQQAGTYACREVDRALKLLREPEGRHLPRLRIAAGSLSSAFIVPQAMALLRDQGHPLRISLVDRPIDTVADLVATGEVDLGIGSVEARLHQRVRLKTQLLTSDTLTVVAAHNSRLATPRHKKVGVTWNDIARQEGELILVGRVGGQWEGLLRDQLEQHPGLRVGYEVQFLATALELVRHDLGWAVLPRFSTRGLDRSAFSVIPLHDAGPSWDVYALAQPGQVPGNPAIGAFIEAALEVLRRAELAEGRSR